MRYLFGFLCVCALGAVPLPGCGGSDSCQGVTCDDGEVCTEDACNPANGTCDFTPVGDGTACADGACLRGDCTALITVSGIVNVIDRSSPPVNATVAVLGTSLSTTTNERGDYSFGAFAGDWVFQAVADGASFVFTYVSDAMCNEDTVPKVRAFIDAAKEAEQMFKDGASREEIGTNVSEAGKKRFWDLWPEG